MTRNHRVFKIQNGAGLFSDGGCRPKFVLNGKSWSSLCKLKKHLNEQRYASNCKIVQIKNKIVIEYKKNSIQAITEESCITENGIGSVLYRFVTYGTIHTQILRDIITGARDLYQDEVDKYVPIAIIDSIDEFVGVGINGCTPTNLGTVILSCTPNQLKMYNLS